MNDKMVNINQRPVSKEVGRENTPNEGILEFFISLNQSLQKQASVIFALIFKDLKTRSNEEDLGLLYLVGIIFEPALGVLAVGAFWYLIRVQSIMGVHTLLFVAVSITAFSIIRRSINTIPRSIKSGSRLYSFPNIKPIDPLLGAFLLEICLTLIGAAIVFFLLYWFGNLTLKLRYPLEAIGMIALLLCSALGISLLVGTYGALYSIITKILNNLSRVIFFTSAVVHPLAEATPVAQKLMLYNPIAHVMEFIRFYTLSIPPFPYASLSFVQFFSGGCIFFGFLVYYANRSRIIRR